MAFEGSYLWRIRQKLGNALILMPGACVVVENDQGSVLLVRRTDTHEWCVPAGAAEEGDSFAGTAINELKEEAGLTVVGSDLVPFGCLSDPRIHTITYPNGDITHCFAMCFAVHNWSGELAPDPDEMSELGFYSLAALPTPMYRPAVKVCDMYERFRSDGRFQAC
jgi:8-oxo-dGTP pyrophosphatase MutT (NUDIX family)